MIIKNRIIQLDFDLKSIFQIQFKTIRTPLLKILESHKKYGNFRNEFVIHIYRTDELTILFANNRSSLEQSLDSKIWNSSTLTITSSYS